MEYYEVIKLSSIKKLELLLNFYFINWYIERSYKIKILIYLYFDNVVRVIPFVDYKLNHHQS